MKVAQSFVNSVLEQGLDEISSKRIGNSSRTIGFGDVYREVEEIWMDCSEEFYQKSFEVLTEAMALENLPSFWSPRSPSALKFFRK